MKEYVKPAAFYHAPNERQDDAAVQSTLVYTGCGPGVVTYSPFQMVFMQQYGFEPETAALIVKLWNILKSRASEWIKDTKDKRLAAAYCFFRLLGGFVYNGGYWNLAAGNVSDVDEDADMPNGAPSAERVFFTRTIGFAESDYRILRYKARVQHALCSSEPLAYKDRFYDAYWNITKNSIGPEVFKERVWDPQAKRMSLKPDFAHFCITVATSLATRLGYGENANKGILIEFADVVQFYGVDTAREYLAGWLGDILLDDHTLGIDDFAADADSLLFSHTIPENNYDVESCLVATFSPLSPRSRARKNQYTRYLKIEDAAALTFRFLYGSYMTLSMDEFIKLLDTESKYKDVSNFFKVTTGRAEEKICKICED